MLPNRIPIIAFRRIYLLNTFASGLIKDNFQAAALLFHTIESAAHFLYFLLQHQHLPAYLDDMPYPYRINALLSKLGDFLEYRQVLVGIKTILTRLAGRLQ